MRLARIELPLREGPIVVPGPVDQQHLRHALGRDLRDDAASGFDHRNPAYDARPAPTCDKRASPVNVTAHRRWPSPSPTLTCHETAIVDVLEHAGFEVASARPTTRVVFDTFDGRLAEAGLRLEHRRDPEVALVLRGAPGEPTARLAGATAPRWPAGFPVGPFGRRLTAITKERALVPLLADHLAGEPRAERHDRRGKATSSPSSTRTSRSRATPCRDGCSSSTRSRATATSGSASPPVCCRSGSPLKTATSPRSPPAPPAGRSRADRARPRSRSTPASLPSPGYRRVLANLADTIEANRPGTIDDIDEEFLHELRVAAAARAPCSPKGKAVLPDDLRDPLSRAFGELGQQTGPAATSTSTSPAGTPTSRRWASMEDRARQGEERDRAIAARRPRRAGQPRSGATPAGT